MAPGSPADLARDSPGRASGTGGRLLLGALDARGLFTPVALGFIDALEKGYTHISRHPASGSTRYSVELNLPGLRSWPVRRFPHIVYYVEATDHVDVWRALHGTRDIPEWMHLSESRMRK